MKVFLLRSIENGEIIGVAVATNFATAWDRFAEVLADKWNTLDVSAKHKLMEMSHVELMCSDAIITVE
jgi:hypothetical protein